MTRQSLHVLFVIGVVLLAGCAGGSSTTPAASSPAPSTPPAETNLPAQSPTPTSTGASSTVAFYISDERNAIDDFRHLNVTVTSVGFERAAGDGGGWLEREVDNVTVDLTELQGANATLVGEYGVPNGTYSKVFVHVSDVNATLENGEHVRVKLPSEKLQLTKEFTVEPSSAVNFVFDITVHRAGKSGKYILKPVISESGTDVPIEPTGGDRQRDEVNVQVVDIASDGENATVAVTRDGEPVANATVRVAGTVIGTTDADGRVTFDVPADRKAKFEIEDGDDWEELEVELRRDAGDERPTDTAGKEPNAAVSGDI